MSRHIAEIAWRSDGGFTDNSYSRRHLWRFDGGAEVTASSSPDVVPVPRSDPAGVDPEEALAASAASCHMLWFLSLAQEAGSAHHVVAPFAQPDVLVSIAAEAGFTLPARDQAWRRASEKYRRDRAMAAGGLMVLLAIAVITMGYGLAALVLIALGLLLAIREYWLWRSERHALDPLQVLNRRGWLAPKLMVAARLKLHSVEIAQGPVARLRGYATLRFGLAGGRLSMRGLPLAEAHVMRAQVLESIAAVDFARLPR